MDNRILKALTGVVAISVLLAGCVGNGRKYFRDAHYCYSSAKDKNPGTGKLRTNGYYLAEFKGQVYTSKAMDTVRTSVYFFLNDGTFFSYSGLKGPIANFDQKFYKQNPYRKGRYTVEHDTIKLIDMDRSAYYKYVLKRTYFKILDSNKLKQIYFAWEDRIPTQMDFEVYQAERTEERLLYYFHENEVLPQSSRLWMLDYSWFWCDQDEYKAYKNSHHK